MKNVTNINEEIVTESQRTHAIKIGSNQLVKVAEENKVPIFIAYYDPKKGYQYNGLFPEEIEADDLSSEYHRFFEFLKVCISFNKESCKPVVSKRKIQKDSK